VTRIVHGYTPPSLPEVSADGSRKELAWVDALGVAIEPSPEAWSAAFAYLYAKGEDYVRALEAL